MEEFDMRLLTYKLNRFLTRSYFRWHGFMNKLEVKANGFDNRRRFHKKYGRGDKCMIADCECKK